MSENTKTDFIDSGRLSVYLDSKGRLRRWYAYKKGKSLKSNLTNFSLDSQKQNPPTTNIYLK